LEGVDRLKVGIDIDYGCVKAINSERQKISFPVMIAPSGNGLGLGDVFKDTVEYQVTINRSKYMVGDAAKKSFLANQTMSRITRPSFADGSISAFRRRRQAGNRGRASARILLRPIERTGNRLGRL